MPGPFPRWAIAAAAFGGGVVTVALFVSDIRSTAAHADELVKDHEPRIRRLELDATTSQAELRAMKATSEEMRADIKEILRRLK